MIENENSTKLDDTLSIRFETPNLDMREIALVGDQLHKMINNVAIQRAKLLNDQVPYARTIHNQKTSPLLVSLKLTDLNKGSIDAEVALVVCSIGYFAADVIKNLLADLVKELIKSLHNKAKNNRDISVENAVILDVMPTGAKVIIGNELLIIDNGIYDDWSLELKSKSGAYLKISSKKKKEPNICWPGNIVPKGDGSSNDLLGNKEESDLGRGAWPSGNIKTDFGDIEIQGQEEINKRSGSA